MNSKLNGVFLVLALLLFIAPETPAQKLQIKSIQARLFYENSGTFSKNVLTDEGFDLWNTPFDWVYSTLVLVEIEGVPKYLEKHRRVELTSRYIPFDRVKGQIIARQMETLRNGSENGLAYAGFWLRNIGCNPVYLTAHIAGQKRIVRETIKFGCGE